jgi:hypothetical protein
MTKEIKLTITPKGIKWDSNGFTGEGCVTAYEKFVAAMKAKGVSCDQKSREMKNEIYAVETTEETVDNGY